MPSSSTVEVLSVCALTILRYLSRAGESGTQPSPANGTASDERKVSSDGSDERSGAQGSAGPSTREGDGKPLQDKMLLPHDCPTMITAIAGSCLSYIAREIDFPSGPKGAMATLLSLLLPTVNMDVREQAALTLGAIAGRGLETTRPLRARKTGKNDADGDRKGLGSDTNQEPTAREDQQSILWRRFCSGMIEGWGAQV